MKGLLIKDFRLLKNQKNFFILVFVMAVFLTITGGDESSPATFVLPYVGFVCSFFVLSTISYDEYDNGNAFLFTLPFDRKIYALEKYIFGIVTGGAGLLLILAFILIYTDGMAGAEQTAGQMGETLFTAGVSAALLFFFLAVMIPFQLKFGPEKGRIAMFIVLLGTMALVFGIVKLAGLDDSALREAARVMGRKGLSGVAAVCIAAAAAVMVISMFISARILEKKEF